MLRQGNAERHDQREEHQRQRHGAVAHGQQKALPQIGVIAQQGREADADGDVDERDELKGKGHGEHVGEKEIAVVHVGQKEGDRHADQKRADEKGCAVMCKYKGWKGKRRGRNGEKAGIYAYWTLSAFWLSFFFEKKNTSTLSAHLLRRSLCAYMGTERKRQKQRKNNILLWFFLFP